MSLEEWKCCEKEPPTKKGWYEIMCEDLGKNKTTSLYYIAVEPKEWCVSPLASPSLDGFFWRGEPSFDPHTRSDFSVMDVIRARATQKMVEENKKRVKEPDMIPLDHAVELLAKQMYECCYRLDRWEDAEEKWKVSYRKDAKKELLSYKTITKKSKA